MNTTPAGGAIRVGDWKLVVNGRKHIIEDEVATAEKGEGKQSFELFNLAEDKSEKKDVSSSHPKKLKQLRERYEVLAGQAVKPKSGGKPKGFKSPAVWGEGR
ncbi:MAG: hypothetical protein EOP85_13260 [Verrucomicrobiaceae bacterium]|nr:MAG: hypothetical protein EOP85_13260 [Verrucomicrobiaceae bacterium]